MLRRVCATTFALAAAGLAACGHQVTPNPTTNDLSGDIVVKFQTSGPLDFQNVTYVIAIDSCGNGVPYPNAFLTGYASYTFAFLLGGGVGNTAEPVLYQYYLNPDNSGRLTRILVNDLNPSTTQLVPNFNGQNNEFSFTFPRSDLNNPFNVPLPCPNSTSAPATATPASSAAATATPTVAAGSSPTASASAGASSSPSATPTPAPGSGDTSTGVSVPPYQTTWVFNLLTFAPNGGVPLDSLGQGGASDQSFQGISVNTSTTTTSNFFRQPGATAPQSASAFITYGEVDTYASRI